jgi:putative nucleotidyltransferase-like protein
VTIDQGLHSLLSREARILLLVAGGECNDALISQLAAQRLDWRRMVGLAEGERASSVLWRRLSRVAPDVMPGEVAERLEQLSMISDFRAVYLQDRCAETLGALRREGIEVILLKGAALAHWAYPSFVERPMGDLDFLVPQERLRDAWRIATASGWEWDSAALPLARYSEHHHLPPLFDSSGTGGNLELHSRSSVPAHPFSLTFAEARDHAQTLSVANGQVLVLEPTYEVINVAVHYAWSHLSVFGGWRAFRDLGAMNAHVRLDWVSITEAAKRYSASSSCFWTFRLASALCGLEVPASALDTLSERMHLRFRRPIERHFASQVFASERPCPSVGIHRFIWGLAINPTQVSQGRPWDLDDVELDLAKTRLSVLKRISLQVRKPFSWWRYLRLLVA